MAIDHHSFTSCSQIIRKPIANNLRTFCEAAAKKCEAVPKRMRRHPEEHANKGRRKSILELKTAKK